MKFASACEVSYRWFKRTTTLLHAQTIWLQMLPAAIKTYTWLKPKTTLLHARTVWLQTLPAAIKTCTLLKPKTTLLHAQTIWLQMLPAAIKASWASIILTHLIMHFTMLYTHLQRTIHYTHLQPDQMCTQHLMCPKSVKQGLRDSYCGRQLYLASYVHSQSNRCWGAATVEGNCAWHVCMQLFLACVYATVPSMCVCNCA